MEDLISRQAAIDASCKDWCGCTYANCPNQFNLESERFCDGCDTVVILKKMPSVQPEIIYCKDCKHVKKDALCGGYWCRGKAVTSYHYCGYAERRKESE